MTKNFIPILLSMFLLGCQNPTKEVNNDPQGLSSKQDTLIDGPIEVNTKFDDELIETNLQDSLSIKGNTIVILRPDSLRFQSYLENGEEWIYEVDSDFGFGISEALDSFNRKNVGEVITEKRYIKIEDCNICPIVIDRDSIDYGIILTGENRDLKLDENVFGRDYYIELFNEYYK